MKILILSNNDAGLYKFRKELIEELIQKKNKVYFSLPFGESVRVFEEMGCTFIDAPIDRRGINPKTDMALFNRYRKMMREVNPDLVITYTIKPNIYGGIAARLAKKKYAVNITGLGTAFENAGLIRTIVITLYKFALKKASVIFFENSANRDQLLSLKVCDQEKTVVLNGAGVNTDTYLYLPYPQGNDCFDEMIRFLYVGRIMKEKGINELFEAMKRLIAEGKQCFLDVVGPFEEDYKDKLEQYENDGWLKYHGYQSDVRPFIKNCHSFVLPSYHEGMANTNLECASSGRPVITSNIPGCKEAVIEGVSGLLCESKNVESLYAVMKQMTEMSAAERRDMGLAGRKHMEDVFDKKKVVEETMKHLK